MVFLFLLFTIVFSKVNLQTGEVTRDASGYDKDFTSAPDSYLIYKQNKLYYNAFITRPYMRYKNKSNVDLIFKKLKSIWNDRDIIIIEGEHTRLGCGNDLFDNVKSIRRILGPARNAFDKYDEILTNTLNAIQSKDTLILASLGATATVLTYDLAKHGYQAIDTGHVDIEYEWMLKGVKKKTIVVGKYVNEVKAGLEYSGAEDKKYINQIIMKIE